MKNAIAHLGFWLILGVFCDFGRPGEIVVFGLKMGFCENLEWRIWNVELVVLSCDRLSECFLMAYFRSVRYESACYSTLQYWF